MHVLILALGSAGDVNPFLLIGSALKAAGHDVELITNPYFERKVLDAGLGFIALGTVEKYEEILGNADIWKVEKGLSAIWNSTMDALPETYQLILQHARPGTLLIASTLGVAARLAQETHGFNLVSVHLSPSIILSGYGMPRSVTSPLPASFPPAIKCAWMRFVESSFIDPICKPALNAYRLKLSLSPVERVFSQWLHSPELVLCTFPDWFAPVQKDWPRNAINTPFPLFKEEHDTPLSEQILDFLSSGEPPLVLTAGTAMAFAKPIFETGLEAAEKLGMRAIVVSQLEHSGIESKANRLVVPYANFESLFMKAAMVCHHGGIGTTAMALHCGVPQIIVPHAHDQFDNGARIELMGAGKMLNKSKCRHLRSWTEAIDALRSESTVGACQSLAAKMNSEPAAAGEIIAVLRDKGLLI